MTVSNQNARVNGGSEEGARGERLSHLRRFSLRAAVSVLLYEPQMEKHTTQNRQLDRLHTGRFNTTRLQRFCIETTGNCC